MPHTLPSVKPYGQRRKNQPAKHVVDFLWTKLAIALHPPIQNENERGGDVLDKKVRRDLARCLPAALNSLSNVIGDQFSEDLLQMFMNDGAASSPHPGCTCLPMSVNVLEYRK